MSPGVFADRRPAPRIVLDVRPTDIVVYRRTFLDNQDQPGIPGRVRVFGHQLAGGGYRPDQAALLWQIPLPLLLRVPPPGRRPGQVWRYTVPLRALETVAGTLVVSGRFRFTGRAPLGKIDCLAVEGDFKFFSLPGGRAAPAGAAQVESGQLKTRALVDPAGVVRQGEARMRLKWRGKPAEVLHAYRLEYERTSRLEGKVLDRAVDKAIGLGMKYISALQRKDGAIRQRDDYPMGRTALALLALLKSGVNRHEPLVKRALAHLRGLPLARTYSVSLLIMALEAANVNPSEAEILAAMRRRGRLRRPFLPRKLSAADLEWMRRAAGWLLARSVDRRVWHYPSESGGRGRRRGFDHSNTQYAVLGLKAASRCGVAVPADVWKRVASHFLAAQVASGPEVVRRVRPAPRPGSPYAPAGPRYAVHARSRGWGYLDRTTAAYGSMTSAGVGTLAIARSGLLLAGALSHGMATRIRQSIHDGLAWMERHYSVLHNPYHGGWFYYYLYGLERACVLTNTAYLGERDWYREGAHLLVITQARGGSWQRNAIETAFALLFLKRATTPVASTE